MANETGEPFAAEPFAATVLPHLDAAHNLARWLVRNPDAAQDVVQDAVMRALTYYPRFKGINPRAWLLQIVRNAAYASMKLNRGLRLVSIGDVDDADGKAATVLQDTADDPERALLRNRDQKNIAGMLERLPVELRETVILRELEDLSYKEIAHITDTPVGTVMSRLWRARQLLASFAQAEIKKA